MLPGTHLGFQGLKSTWWRCGDRIGVACLPLQAGVCGHQG